jgi:hypothetical protein
MLKLNKYSWFNPETPEPPLDFSENHFQRLEEFHLQFLDYLIQLPPAPTQDLFWLHANKWLQQDKASLSHGIFTLNKENLLP